MYIQKFGYALIHWDIRLLVKKRLTKQQSVSQKTRISKV